MSELGLEEMRKRLHYKLGDLVTVQRKIGDQIWDAVGIIVGGSDTFVENNEVVHTEPRYIVLEITKVDGFGNMPKMHNVTEDEIKECWHTHLPEVVREVVDSPLNSAAFHIDKGLRL